MYRPVHLIQSGITLDFLAPRLISQPWKNASIRKTSHAVAVDTRKRGQTSTQFTQKPVRTSDNLRQSLENLQTRPGSIKDVESSWKMLNDSGGLVSLSSATIDQLSRSFAANMHSDSTLALKDDQFGVLENIAIALFKNWSTAALHQCMVARIRRNEPDHALYLYDLYKKQKTPGGISNEEKQGTSTLTSIEPETDAEDANTLLIPMLVARIQRQDTFGDIFTEVQTLPRFHLGPTELEDFFALHLAHDDILTARCRRICRQIHIARLVSAHAYLASYVSDLSRRSWALLMETYHGFEGNLSDSDGVLTTNSRSISPQRPVLVGEAIWGVFLHAILHSPLKSIDERLVLAEQVWNDMAKHGTKAGQIVWSSLVQGHVEMGRENDAIEAWNSMTGANVKPDVFAYQAMIKLQLAQKRTFDTLQWIRRFEEAIKKGDFGSQVDQRQLLVVYNSAIDGLLRMNKVKDVLEVMRRMKTNGVERDVVTCNTLLAHYASRDEFKSIGLLLQEMDGQGIKPDVVSISVILGALLRLGKKDAVETVFRLLQNYGIAPNAVIYTRIIEQQVSSQTVESLRAALEILKKMESDPAIQPTHYTYAAVLSGIYRGSWLDEGLANEAETFVVERMRRRKITWDKQIYTALFKATTAHPGYKGAQRMIKLFLEMKAKGIEMDSKLQWGGLKRLVQLKDWNAAKMMLNEITRPMQLSPSQQSCLDAIKMNAK